jgi:hypothetical protein
VQKELVMTKLSCYLAFGEGKAQRVSYPLREGRYKLEELEGSFISLQRTLYMVRDFVSGDLRSTYLLVQHPFCNFPEH